MTTANHVSRWLLCLLALSTWIDGALAKVWTVDEFPNPQTQTSECGRPGVGGSWVCDPDGILQAREADIIEGVLKQIARAEESYAKSPCGSEETPGYQVAVAVMNEASVVSDNDSLEFARDLLDKWGVGHSECNDGVLLVVMIRNRKIAVATGKAASKKIYADDIIKSMRPYMRSMRYGAGIQVGATEIGHQLAKGATAMILEYIIPTAFVAIIVSCICGSWLSGQKKKTAKEKIQMLKEAERAVRDGTYEATSCPICFDRFEHPPQGNHRDDTSSDDDEGFDEWGPLLFKHKHTELTDEEKKRLGEKRKLPVTLQCGHSFCEPCLLEWLDHNETCPICRKSIPQISDPSSNPATYSTASNQHWTSTSWDSEMHFRLNRLGVMYPGYMTPGLIDMWYMDYRLGRDFDYRSHQDFKSWDPAQQSHLASYGHSGGGGDFGGGSADAGGGGAGGW